jgi:hypothetical protein
MTVRDTQISLYVSHKANADDDVAHGKLLGASSVRAANGSTVAVDTLAPKPGGGLKSAAVGF